MKVEAGPRIFVIEILYLIMRKIFIVDCFVLYTETMVDEKAIMVLLEEVSKIRQLLEMVARDSLKAELEKIATTPTRKRMWALLNGMTSTEEIAKKVNSTQRSVQIFVKELRNADLITMEKRGYPKRKFDYIPAEWGIEME